MSVGEDAKMAGLGVPKGEYNIQWLAEMITESVKIGLEASGGKIIWPAGAGAPAKQRREQKLALPPHLQHRSCFFLKVRIWISLQLTSYSTDHNSLAYYDMNMLQGQTILESNFGCLVV